jgi:nucleoside-diphosphate-sugar epimerase
MKILILGGTGFLSGAMVRVALGAGHEVFALTRGKRPVPQSGQSGFDSKDVHRLVADRNDPVAFARALAGATKFDLVVDCIGYTAEHARQDLDSFFPAGSPARTEHLVFISTDFTCSPVDRPWKIDETFERFVQEGYGGGKRSAEEVLLAGAQVGEQPLPITILRPCHIYGPGSLLGCLPRHARDADLLGRIKRQEALLLVGDGQFLQQPIFVDDLAAMALGCAGNHATNGQLYFAAGPDIVASRQYYQIIGEHLHVPVIIEEASIAEYLKEHPDQRAFFCHRVYDLGKAKLHGLVMPATPLREGLRRQVESLAMGG